MKRRTYFLGLITTGVLTGSMLAAVPSTAQAAPAFYTEPRVSANVGLYDNTPTCVVPPGNSITNGAEAPGANGTATATASTESTADASNKGIMSGTSTVTSSGTARPDGSFASATVTVTGTASTSLVGSSCRPRANVGGTLYSTIYLPTGGTFTLTGTSPGPGASAGAEISGLVGDEPYGDRSWDNYLNVQSGTRTVSTWVPAGSYQIGIGGYAYAGSPGSASTPATFSGTMTASLTFTPDTPKGIALGKTKGKAKKLVAFPATRSCVSGTAEAKWKKKAKKQRKQIRSVVFTVGKKKVGQVKNVKPKQVKQGKAIKLKKLPAKAVTVKAKIKLRNGKTLAAKQKYSAC